MQIINTIKFWMFCIQFWNPQGLWILNCFGISFLALFPLSFGSSLVCLLLLSWLAAGRLELLGLLSLCVSSSIFWKQQVSSLVVLLLLCSVFTVQSSSAVRVTLTSVLSPSSPMLDTPGLSWSPNTASFCCKSLFSLSVTSAIVLCLFEAELLTSFSLLWVSSCVLFILISVFLSRHVTVIC